MMAEELYASLFADAEIKRKLAIAASNVFPGSGYMRWWSALARRGKRGLAACLPLANNLAGRPSPGALHRLWRVRRAKGQE